MAPRPRPRRPRAGRRLVLAWPAGPHVSCSFTAVAWLAKRQSGMPGSQPTKRPVALAWTSPPRISQSIRTSRAMLPPSRLRMVSPAARWQAAVVAAAGEAARTPSSRAARTTPRPYMNTMTLAIIVKNSSDRATTTTNWAVTKPPSRARATARTRVVRSCTYQRSSMTVVLPFSLGGLPAPKLAEDDRRQWRADEDEQHRREDGDDREDGGRAVAGGHAAQVLAALVAQVAAEVHEPLGEVGAVLGAGGQQPVGAGRVRLGGLHGGPGQRRADAHAAAVRAQDLGELVDHGAAAALDDPLHRLDHPAADADVHRQQVVDGVELDPHDLAALLDDAVEPTARPRQAEDQPDRAEEQHHRRGLADQQPDDQAEGGRRRGGGEQ